MSKTNAMTLKHAAAMPAPTWNFLKMNNVDVEIPEGLDIAPDVTVDEPWSARAADDEFENALFEAQEAWEAEHPVPTAEELAQIAEARAAEADATYGGTAQSAYQAGADALEEARSLPMAFEGGLGDEASAVLRNLAGGPIAIVADAGGFVNVQVAVRAVEGAASVGAIDLIAYEGSTACLSIVVDSPDAPENPQGIVGTTLRVFAAANSKVEVTRSQTLDDGFVDLDDIGIFADSSAHVRVSQTVLGATRTYTGLAADLRGSSARADISTRYLGRGEQVHDFNYIVRHHGPKTECDLNANGVLSGRSSKTLRGTIDLIRGAKGAQGSERESVLLVDEGVTNKTVPVILCNEDDVAGNHGATIGHIRAEQMFYLASRGLSQDDAEHMFVGAIVEQAAIDAVDDAAREGVLRLGDKLLGGFSQLFDDEA